MKQRTTPGVLWIFATEAGGPMSRRNVARAWDAAVRGNGLPRISLHGARHTFVTTALANGVAQNLVASYAGHTPATMNSVYWDAVPGHG